MTFANLVRSDLSEGLRSARGRVALLAVGGGCLSLLQLLFTMAIDYWDPPFTFGEAIVAAMGGMSVFDPDHEVAFRFPAGWMLMLMLVAYIPLSYPYRDLMGYGREVLVASGSRWSWWLSKCLWVTLVALLGCALLVVACAIVSLLWGGEPSLLVPDGFLECAGLGSELAGPYDLRPFVLVFPLMVVAVCLLQLALSLALGPTLAFASTSVVLLASAYLFHPLLPGEYLMIARLDLSIPNGMSLRSGAIYALVIAAASVLVGGLHFSRMDCIDKELSI